MTVAVTSHLAQMPRNASTSAGVDDRHHPLLRLAHQDLFGAERGVAQRHRVELDLHAAVPPPAASSVVAQDSPAAPRSWMPASSPAALSSRQHSIRSFSMNGSPTWTLGRFADSPPSNVALASTGRPADAVGAGAGAEQDDLVAGSPGRGEPAGPRAA